MELYAAPSLPKLPTVIPSRLRSFPPSFRLHHSRLRKFVTRASDESRIDVKPFFPTEVTVVVEDTPPKDESKAIYAENGPTQQDPPKEENAEVEAEQNEFLASLKFDSDNTYSLILYGGGALVFLWVTSAVVSAVDSIPLFSKLMEVVGLGYATWFTIRYVLFKKNREELAAKFEELKQQVIGSNDD